MKVTKMHKQTSKVTKVAIRAQEEIKQSHVNDKPELELNDKKTKTRDEVREPDLDNPPAKQELNQTHKNIEP